MEKKITGYKSILCPTTILCQELGTATLIWRGYIITFKRVRNKNIMKIERKSGVGKLTVLDLEQITETTSGKGIPATILNSGFIKD